MAPWLNVSVFFGNLWPYEAGGLPKKNGAGGFQKNGARGAARRLSLIGLAEWHTGAFFLADTSSA